jgi:hypothetical protein
MQIPTTLLSIEHLTAVAFEERDTLQTILTQWENVQIQHNVSQADLHIVIEAISSTIETALNNPDLADFVVSNSTFEDDAELLYSDINITALPEIFHLDIFKDIFLFELKNLVRLTQLPDLTALHKIRHFEVVDCSIHHIPPRLIQSNPELEIFWVSGTQITEIPNEICNLTRLELLDLSYNSLVRLPENIGYLNYSSPDQSILGLKINHNKLISLPNSIEQLTRWDISYADNLPLCTYRLDNNQINYYQLLLTDENLPANMRANIQHFFNVTRQLNWIDQSRAALVYGSQQQQRQDRVFLEHLA